MNERINPKGLAPTRDDLEAAIENAIDALNALDDEPDLEPEETDHSSSEDGFEGKHFANDAALMVDDEPDAEGEPSLGSLACVGYCGPFSAYPIGFSQISWANGGDDDREQDAGDEREVEADCEAWHQDAVSSCEGAVPDSGSRVGQVARPQTAPATSQPKGTGKPCRNRTQSRPLTLSATMERQS